MIRKQLLDLLNGQIEQFERCGVDPVNVLEDEQDRVTLRHGRHMPDESIERLLLPALRRASDRRMAAAERERQQLGKEHHILGDPGVCRYEHLELAVEAFDRLAGRTIEWVAGGGGR